MRKNGNGVNQTGGHKNEELWRGRVFQTPEADDQQ